MTFDALEPRESAVDACAASIRRAILGGELAVGARLPPERELAARFGVNRVTVRSALGRLAASRLVSVRQGSGYVVQDFRRAGGPELLSALAELGARRPDQVAIARDLLLVRRHLARAVLERIAELPRVDVEPVERAVAGLEHTHGGSAEIARADMDVLAAIVELTGSAVFGLCLNPVLSVVAAMPRLRDAIYRDAARSVEGYRLLLAWLAAPRVDTIDAVVAELERRDEETLERL